MPKMRQTEESMGGGEGIEKSKDVRILAAIGYLWILCLLPLLGKRESAFAQHHGKQGLVLTICSFVIMLIWWVPLIGWLIGFFGTIGLLVFVVLGIQNAMQGKYWEMPVLGKYAKQIKL